MPTINYNRPSLADLKKRIATDLAAVPLSLSVPLSSVWANAANAEHGFLEWLYLQCSPLTCELERLYDWATVYNVQRLNAVAATGNVIATGTAGTVVLAETLLRGNNGLDYSVVSAVTLGSGDTMIPVRCMTAGVAGNLIAGQTLSVIDPIPGCNGTMAVGSWAITGGADAETVDDWRLRVVLEWQTMVTYGARSGRPDDYKYWARSAHPSVTNALVIPQGLGIGTVVIRPFCNSLANRQPTTAIIDAVKAKFALVAPATADWRVVAPLTRSVALTLHLQPAVDNYTNRTAITAAFNNAVLAETIELATISLAEIDAAILSVTDQYTRSAPTADTTALVNEVLVPGAVTFT